MNTLCWHSYNRDRTAEWIPVQGWCGRIRPMRIRDGNSDLSMRPTSDGSYDVQDSNEREVSHMS